MIKPASLVLASGMAALAVFFVAAAIRSWRFPLDGFLLLIGAGVTLGCCSFWILELFGKQETMTSPALVIASLLLSPITLYLLAFVFGIRFFLTNLAGWPRYAYLVGALASLSPLILIIGVGMIAALAGRGS